METLKDTMGQIRDEVQNHVVQAVADKINEEQEVNSNEIGQNTLLSTFQRRDNSYDENQLSREIADDIDDLKRE